MVIGFINKKLAASNDKVKYYITSSESDGNIKFGISAEEVAVGDIKTTEAVFFTETEAIKCCEYLAENTVYPISISDTLHNIYFF